MKNQHKAYRFIAPLLLLIAVVTFSCKKEDPAPLPFADFQSDNNGCISPCWMHFYDNSQNAVEWEWYFGNGFNSTTQNDSAYYTSFGFYDVTLWVKNSDGVADSVTKEVMVY
ncbi:MAG: PKD domain-containing protein [Bacteroidetes bacterium]|nr:PKD domain-containing protein [Bacteroidota bacterium]